MLPQGAPTGLACPHGAVRSSTKDPLPQKATPPNQKNGDLEIDNRDDEATYSKPVDVENNVYGQNVQVRTRKFFGALQEKGSWFDVGSI